MSRDVWLDVAFHYPSTMVRIRDARSGEEIINLSAEQDYTWKAGGGDLRLDGVNIVGIQLHAAKGKRK